MAVVIYTAYGVGREASRVVRSDRQGMCTFFCDWATTSIIALCVVFTWSRFLTTCFSIAHDFTHDFTQHVNHDETTRVGGAVGGPGGCVGHSVISPAHR